MIKNIQNGIASVIEKIMWLEDEKIYGNNLIKLFRKINKNNVININEGDLKFFDLYNIKISLFNIENLFFIIQLIRLGRIHIIFGIKIIMIIVLIQLISKFRIVVEGSKILNKFIIIFFI
jgi:hypothetical protein